MCEAPHSTFPKPRKKKTWLDIFIVFNLVAHMLFNTMTKQSTTVVIAPKRQVHLCTFSSRLFTFCLYGEKQWLLHLDWPKPVRGCQCSYTKGDLKGIMSRLNDGRPKDQVIITAKHLSCGFGFLIPLNWYHIYDIAEKTPQQHFGGSRCVSSSKSRTKSTRISVVITLWVSLTKYQIINFMNNTSD
jgi:hypothetical protein